MHHDDRLALVRSAYDVVAESYARGLPDACFAAPLRRRPDDPAAPLDLPGVFAEFFRVLAPGGYSLISFQVGEGSRQISRAYGHDVSMDAQLFPPAAVIEDQANAGFTMVAQMTREPGTARRLPKQYSSLSDQRRAAGIAG